MSKVLSSPGAPAPRRPDVRLAGLGIALGGIVLFGAVVSVLPSSASDFWPRLLSGEWLGSFRTSTHADVQRKREIDERFRQGVVMLQAKQFEHALTAFHRVLELNPNIAEAYVNAGFAMLGLKRYKEAADFFNDATDVRKDQMNAYYGLGLALEGLGDLEGAVGAMRTYTHLAGPEDPYQRRAWSALWEWETELKIRRGEQPPIPPEAIAPREPAR